MEKIKCLLDNELFTCRICKGEFSHVDGTWLPVGIEKKSVLSKVKGSVTNPPIHLMLDLRKPEVITSDEFTCYNCI